MAPRRRAARHSGTRKGRHVAVSVRDTGVGIDPGVLPLVFEPFVTGKPDGTGLGLFIAVRIIEGHGGKLELDSTPGKGTTFIITLPPAEEDTP